MSAETRIVIAGFGGQGALFAGKLISYAGLIEGREVSWLPSYGPEMRGGTANCSVTLADEPIGSPLVLDPNVLIAMNQPSFDKFIGAVAPGGVVVADSSLVPNITEPEGVRVFAIPAQEMAEAAGMKGLGNVVLVGKLLSETQFCQAETLEAAMAKCVPARKAAMLQKNLEALKLGMGA